jgi:GT2 family glycosyltransferase
MSNLEISIAPRVSVLVATYRRFVPFLDTVRALQAQRYQNLEIIIADQNAVWPEEHQRTVAALKSDPRIQWLVLPTPGVVSARNQAVKRSSGEILVFVDDDIAIPDPFFIHRHVRNYQDASVAAVVGRERTPRDAVPAVAPGLDLTAPETASASNQALSPLQQALWFDRNSDHRCFIITFCTCNSSIRREIFLSVGGLDESFTGNSYGDDYDLALRLHKKGVTILYDPEAWLVHLRAPSGGLRLSDRTNVVDMEATAFGLWLFFFRHGYRGMYGHLLMKHVLRKTVLVKRNLFSPPRLLAVIKATVTAFFRARTAVSGGPHSLFVQSSSSLENSGLRKCANEPLTSRARK